MTCPFCGNLLPATRKVTCSESECRNAAKRMRQRARDERQPKPPRVTYPGDGRTWDFPPELEYLDQDPGLPIDQLRKVNADGRLQRVLLAKRALRRQRLKERLAEVL